MPRSYLVYKLTHTTGKSYVGLTGRDLWWRVSRHYRNPESVIGRALRRYGLEQFDAKVLASSLTLEQACRLEIHFIRKFNTLTPNGYNIAEGGRVAGPRSVEELIQHCYKRSLTWEDIKEMRLLAREIRIQALAGWFGVDDSQVSKILNNKRWRDPKYVPAYLKQIDRSGKVVMWQPNLF